jgi:hypothetical protein
MILFPDKTLAFGMQLTWEQVKQTDCGLVCADGDLGRVSPIFSKFLINNPANFLLLLLSGTLPIACTNLAEYS